MVSNSPSSSSGMDSDAPATFSRRWATDEVPGISKMFGDRCRSHARATAMRGAPRRSATEESVSDCKRRKASEGEVWNIRDALCGERIDEVVIGAVCKVVKVLHAHDRCNRLSLDHLFSAHGADSQVFN